MFNPASLPPTADSITGEGRKIIDYIIQHVIVLFGEFSLDDLIPATNQLLQSGSIGELTPNDAHMISALIEQQCKTIISTLPLLPIDDL
jgi:hypothetical protein